MKWSIKIKPTSASLSSWLWLATREDQENVLTGDQAYATGAAASTAARLAIQEYEDNVMVVRNATTIEEFTPEGVEPAPEVVE